MRVLRRARWRAAFVAAALATAVVGGAAHAESAFQGTQTSTDANANTGASSGTNSSSFVGGAHAEGANASAQQDGSNTGAVEQTSKGSSGSAVAGGQIVGANGADVTVQNTNNAEGAFATSGIVTLVNDTGADGIQLGALAEGDDGDATASQIGDNELALEQVAQSDSGDAVAGSQVTGITGPGAHTVQNSNVNVCTGGEITPGAFEPQGEGAPCATTGQGNATNNAFVTAGALADADAGLATTSQNGDNAVDAAQSAKGFSGDAMNGAQITGIAGEADATVQVTNSSTDGNAQSGNGVSTNTFGGAESETVAGAIADSEAGDALAEQIGDNSVDLTQKLQAAAGDAVAGTQVTGAVGDGGDLVVQGQNSSDSDSAFAGSDTANNLATFDVGTSSDATGLASAEQIGDNDLVALQDKSGPGNGDATAGSQIVGATGFDTAAVQGQNDAIDGEASSRADAVAGSQITGIEASDEITTQEQNSSENNFAETRDSNTNSYANVLDADVGAAAVGDTEAHGSQIGDNSANVTQKGRPPSAILNVGAFGGVTITGDATAEQIGDNAIKLSQAVSRSSGDAVAGSQVSGLIGSDGAEIDALLQNDSLDDTAISGDVNINTAALPSATLFAGASAGAEGDAAAEQIGDNGIKSEQKLTITTGDAVGGSQVSGLVAGDGSDLTLSGQNNATGTTVTSGSGVAAQDFVRLIATAGPFAGSNSGEASVQQSGDDAVAAKQTFTATTGDAVGGSQVSGLVGGEGSTAAAQLQNNCPDGCATVTSGSVTSGGDTTDADINAGPFARGETGASASQIGDADLTLSQAVTATTGDAVGGSQISGLVGFEDVTTQVSNSADAPTVLSGSADLSNAATGNAGPAVLTIAGDAAVSGIGDTSTDVAQKLDSTSGDAVSGGQITGTTA